MRDRPDPDAILRTIKETKAQESVGQLRIFLGMSAGVGKTYSMLRAAHKKLTDGVDVVVGIVETHGRSETAEQLKGLKIIARKKMDYRGTFLEEMDIDEILKLKPQLVIVDELAHTNVPNSRHDKRYQDVLELLDAGIDVFTAFNVQHLESRKDSVEAITGIAIRETVPDSILERAKLVELVDIAPSELLKRLQEGKVYLGDRADRAQQNFFKEDKLTALREIALRITAERVDQDLQRFVNRQGDASPWQTNERLLVAVSHSPYSEKLIRATRRLAYNLEAPWVALHVDTGVALNDRDQTQLAKNMNLARELKAEVINTTEVDVPSAIARICRIKNVTQVVVGRPTRRWFRDIIERGDLLGRLVRENLDVDIHVSRQESLPLQKQTLVDEISDYQFKLSPIPYWYSLCILLATSIAGAFVDGFIGYRAVGFLFLLSVLLIGMFGSIGAVILGAALSTLIWDYFFIPPKMTFAISNTEDFLMCVAFFVVALITGFLTNRIRFHEQVIREREERTNVLYEVLQDIANANEKSDFLTKVTNRVGKLLNARCGVVLKSMQEKLEFDSLSDYSLNLDEKDQAVASWCFEHDRSAGWSTSTLSQSPSFFLPLRGTSENVGVFIFQPINKNRKLGLEKESLLFSIVRQLGVSVEKHFLSKRLIESQRLKDSENLHQTLLSSISHEMRTPLTAILGSASALENEGRIPQTTYVKEIASSLHEAGDRLNRVIENLLDMSRLDSGVLSLHLEWHDFNDLIGVVIKKLEKQLLNHKLKVNFLEDPPLLRIDFRLMEHAISNIILNAALYTPKGTQIKISLEKRSSLFTCKIEDNGPGIAPEFLDRIFDKFYRIPHSPPGGTGLGLSIVKSIIELHQGTISASNLDPRGLAFLISIPVEQQPEKPSEVEP